MKAVGLFSGGLDSILAIKLIMKQGISVVAVSFTSPFFVSDSKAKEMKELADLHGFKIHFIPMDSEYFDIVRNPKHGHGKNMNPCIDCHAYMFKKAAEYAKEIKADFLFSGEVLDERPMSQNKKALVVVEEEAGLSGKLLRPLSAKLLAETEAEKKGLVDRSKLLDLQGRGRRKQIALADSLGVKDYESPAGGCLLTDIGYSKKLKDLFDNSSNVSEKDIRLLKFGRHFRSVGKIIVGRNKEDNDMLLSLKKGWNMMQAKDIMGPITLFEDDDDVKLAAGLTARYSDSKSDTVEIEYGVGKFNKSLVVSKIKDKEIEKIRI